MNFKKINHKLHLWLGLPSAVIVFFVCLSGSLFVFCDEIINFATRDISTVTPQSSQVTVDAMLKTVKIPTRSILSYNVLHIKKR